MASILRLKELFGEKYERNIPTLKINNKSVTSTDINDAVLQSIPFISTSDKTWILDRSDVKPVEWSYSGIPQSKTINSIDFIRVVANKDVMVYNQNVEKKLVPRMLININSSEVKPGVCVFVNTGYVIKPSADSTGQFIILPTIVCKSADGKNCNIISNIYARDEDDSGLYTVSFTLLEGPIPTKIQVTFTGFNVESAEAIELHEREPNNDIFKLKDMKSGRSVKNLKIKTHFNTLATHNDNNVKFAEFKTFNDLISPPQVWPKQTLRIKKSVLITSRRREWLQENLITHSGLWTPTMSITPLVYTKIVEDYPIKNTHCITIINSRCVLHSKKIEHNNYYGLSLLNGGFSSIKDCAKVQKHLGLMNGINEKINFNRSIIESMHKKEGLAFHENAKICNSFQVYDALQEINNCIDEMEIKTEMEIVKQLNLAEDCKTRSSMLAHSMCWLATRFMGGKRGSSPIDDTPNEAKKNKLDN